MKQKLLFSALGAIACLWLTLAQAVAPNPQFLGSWEMDLSKTQPKPPFKSQTLTFKDAGGGKWSMELAMQLADGSVRGPPPSAVSLDGKPNPVAGGSLSVAFTFSDPATANLIITQDGKTMSTETYKLSADGQQLVHTLDVNAPGGKVIHQTQTFNRKK